MKQFRLQALALGALMIAAPAQAINVSNIDVNQLMNEANQIKNKLAFIMPIFDQVVGYVVSGDFNGLRSYLQGQAAVLDLAPVIMTLQEYFEPMKALLKQGLDTVGDQVSNLPKQYQGSVREAVRYAKENLNAIDVVKNNLSSIATQANLAMAIGKIVDALQIAAKDARFMRNLNTFRTNAANAYDTVAATNFAVIPEAAKVAQKMVAGKEVGLDEAAVLGDGLGQVRQLVPALVAILQQFTKFALQTNKQLIKTNQMPAEVASAMDAVNSNASKIYSAVTSLNAKFDEALTAAGL